MKKMTLILTLTILALMPVKTMAANNSLGLCKITAFCPCEECSDNYGRQTATQRTARSGHTVAVDPDVVAYGTILKIGGHEYVAEDCGAHVVGDHIDIFVDTHEEVREFGKKYKKVQIIGRNWHWPEGED